MIRLADYMTKNVIARFVTCLTASSAFAQGTVSYQATLDGAHAVPANSSTWRSRGSLFTIDANRSFSGWVALEDHGITAVALFRSTSVANSGTHLYDFDVGPTVVPDPLSGDPGSQQFDLSRTFTPSEAADLQSGFLWISVITPGFPNGELRGQITAVPEPTIIALLALGAMALLICKGQRAAGVV
jgi:hypothetical protein